MAFDMSIGLGPKLPALDMAKNIEDIGARLGLSPKTAANHQSSIKQKLGANSALQLILIAQQFGLLQGP